jgi:hypothetical protein
MSLPHSLLLKGVLSESASLPLLGIDPSLADYWLMFTPRLTD